LLEAKRRFAWVTSSISTKSSPRRLGSGRFMVR